LTGRHGLTVITCKGWQHSPFLTTSCKTFGATVSYFYTGDLAKMIRKRLETYGTMIIELIIMVQKHFESFRDVDMSRSKNQTFIWFRTCIKILSHIELY
jgi:copper oxidase (laccase) domain-containing protein